MARLASTAVVIVPTPISTSAPPLATIAGRCSKVFGVLRVNSIERTPLAARTSMTGAYSAASRARSTAMIGCSRSSAEGASRFCSVMVLLVVRLPVVDGAVELEAVDRQVCGCVLEGCRKIVVVVHSEPGVVARVQQPVLEGVARREDVQGVFGVLHVLLDGEVEVQRRRLADGGDVGRAVEAGLDLVDACKIHNLLERADAAGVGDGAAHVVDELLGDERLVVEDGVEDLTDGERRRGLRA